jgi:outer membrane receptor protein involved in Fe transport
MTAAKQGWFAIVLLAIAMVGGNSPAARAASGPSPILHFNIPSGKLVDRMSTFALQSELQVLYKFDGIQDIETQAVIGDLTPAQALEKMLAGTDIVPEFVKPQTVALTRRALAGDVAIGTGRAGSRTRPGLRSEPTDRRTVRSDRPVEVELYGKRPYAPSLPEIPGINLIQLDRVEIDALGVATVPEVLRTLPQVFGGGPSEDTNEIGHEAATNPTRGSSVNIRGMGAGSTLIMLNGRRLALGGTEGLYVDVSTLPLIAVESIQIVPESSSTVFGADAVGGTVNFVMRDHFDGRLTTGHFGTTTQGDLTEGYAGQIFGLKTDFGSGILSFDFYQRGALPAERRPQVTSDLARFGGGDFDLTTASPGTILIGPTTYAIPSNQDGTHLNFSSLVPGTRNQRDKFAGADVLGEQQRWSVYGTWKHALSGSLSLFTDALFSQRTVRGDAAAVGGNIPIPASNPFRPALPANVPVVVAYNFAKELGNAIGDGGVKTDNLAAGLDWDVGLWNIVGTSTYASERLDFHLFNTLDRVALATALVDPNPATALNLFADGNHTNPATIAKLRATAFSGSRSYLKSLNVTANGPVLPLPGGNFSVVAGAEYREQSFASTVRQSAVSPAQVEGSGRNVRALFAEARVPLWGASNRRPALERLELSIGIRFEDYSDFGRSTTPRYAVEWSPWPGTTVHGSRAHSFRAPSLYDMNEGFNAITVAPLPDPSAPGGLTSTMIWSGKNADIREETARSWSAGFDVVPRSVPGLSFATTYFDIDFTDRLSDPSSLVSAGLLSDPNLASMVIRNPTVAQIANACARATQFGLRGASVCQLPVTALVDLRLRNDARMKTRGVDVITKYRHDFRFGSMSFGLNGTYIIDFATATAPGQPLLDRVSTQSNPIDLRIRSSAGWKRGGLDLTTYVNFWNHYQDTVSAPHREVSSLTTFDVNLAYTLSAERGWGFGETTVALSAQNVFDKGPPFLNNSTAVIGYDQENGDILGRFVSFTIRQNW